MENKYYTPTIEEFHVGFEFEEKITNYSDKNNWIKKAMPFPNNYGFMFGIEVPKNLIRVKYLDQEDIESLGFIFKEDFYSKTLKESCWLFENKNMNLLLTYYPNIKKISILTKDPSKNKIMSKTSWDNNSIALVTIKNKSELKKLLQQLSVENDH